MLVKNLITSPYKPPTMFTKEDFDGRSLLDIISMIM